jgi:hypothetical protein
MGTHIFQTVEKVAKCFYEKVRGRKLLLTVIQTDKKTTYFPRLSATFFELRNLKTFQTVLKSAENSAFFEIYFYILQKLPKDHITAFCHFQNKTPTKRLYKSF